MQNVMLLSKVVDKFPVHVIIPSSSLQLRNSYYITRVRRR